MATNTPTEKALRLITTELKATRVELKATRTTLGRMSATLVELGKHMKGMQVALGERERDFSEKHDQIGQRLQTAHERVAGIDTRLERVERVVRLKPA